MSRGKLYEKSNATTPFSSSDCVILGLYPPRCLPLLVPLFRCVYEIYRVFSKNTTKSITRVSLEGCCENLVQPRQESAEILVYRRFCQIEIASGCQHPVTKEMSSGWMFMGGDAYTIHPPLAEGDGGEFHHIKHRLVAPHYMNPTSE